MRNLAPPPPASHNGPPSPSLLVNPILQLYCVAPHPASDPDSTLLRPRRTATNNYASEEGLTFTPDTGGARGQPPVLVLRSPFRASGNDWPRTTDAITGLGNDHPYARWCGRCQCRRPSAAFCFFGSDGTPS